MEKKNNELTRRNFIKSAAIGAGATVISGTMGNAFAASNEVPKKWDLTTDVVIIGFGGAGATAAIEAHDAGAKVLILERRQNERRNPILMRLIQPIPDTSSARILFTWAI